MNFNKEDLMEALRNYYYDGDTDISDLRTDYVREDIIKWRKYIPYLMDTEIYFIWSWYSNELSASWMIDSDDGILRVIPRFIERWK